MKIILLIIKNYLALISIIRSYIIKKSFYNCGNGFRIGRMSKLYGIKNIDVKNNVNIGDFAYLNCLEKENKVSLTIGNNVSIGRFSQINAYGSVVIGDDVLISDNVFMSDCTHDISDISLPIKSLKDYFAGDIIIDKSSWIGKNVVILPGVTIGEGAVIAANSVVNKNVGNYEIHAGNPAKLINIRK